MISEFDIVYKFIPAASIFVGTVAASAILLRGYNIYTDEKRAYDARLQMPGPAEEAPEGPTYIGSLRKVFAKPENSSLI